MTTESPSQNETTPEKPEIDLETETSHQWGDSAPKGGRTVLNRILKDGAKVPLFLGQTVVKSLRDVGYNSTTSAICEHIDNALQWGADEVRVYFNQSGKRGAYKMDVLVLDNGQGMPPHVLKVATSFGGSMVYENRSGIGRFGMGMKTAALSMSPVLDVYSWQEPQAIYSMTLDVEAIGSSRSNLVELDDPELHADLPSEITDILTIPMAFPKNPDDTQWLFAEDRDEVREQLGNSGTIVFMPDCDRLTYRTAKPLVEHATQVLGRVYRRYIAEGKKIFVNNRQVEAFDPTYWMTSARHTKVAEITTKQSQLIRSWPVEIPVEEDSTTVSTALVKLYMLPIQEWGSLPRKVLKNNLQVFGDHTVSFMRNDREVEIGSSYRKLGVSKHSDNNWLRLQIDFSGELDEAFGVAANKQGVRPKGYVLKAIHDKIGEELKKTRDTIKKSKAEQSAATSGTGVGKAERQASDTDVFQGKQLPFKEPTTEEEKAALDQNLRALAVGLKRDDESDDEAFERVNSSNYIITFRHDDYWPFYHCDFQYGKVILTINKAHPFFTQVWQPLAEIAKSVDGNGHETDDGVLIPQETATKCPDLLVAIQLLLLSLGRTQSHMSLDVEEHRKMFETLRREWSGNFKTQLETK